MSRTRKKTRKKPVTAPVDLSQPINPHFIYRKYSLVVRHVIGLGPTQMDAKIKKGELPPTIPLSDSGKAQGYTGQQLIDIQTARLAKAATLQATTRDTEAA